MPLVTVRVQDANGQPVAGAHVEVLKGFDDDPCDFLFPPPARLFTGTTEADGSLTFEAVAGRATPMPHLVVVRGGSGTVALPPNPRWRHAAPGAAAAIQLIGHPDGRVSTLEGAASAGQVALAFVGDEKAKPRRRLLRGVALVAGAVVAAGAAGAVSGLLTHVGSGAPAVRPVTVLATFTVARGGCPGLGPSFTERLALTRTGDGVRVFQPVALDTVTGSISADGHVVLGNDFEQYVGSMTGASASGVYRITDPRTRCTATYDFAWVPATPG